MHKSTYLAIIVRVFIALCTRTFFQPDEYFQSLEPAHHLVFGYGHLTWEWLAPKPIRSILYPLLNVPIFWVLKQSGFAEAGAVGDWLLIACPKVLHGVLAACTDIYMVKLTCRVIGPTYASTALLVSLSSFFHALALSRSLSNSLETSITTIAFAYYPWDASSKLSPQLIFNRSRLRKLFFLSALGCMIRPTNAIIWVFLYTNLLWSIRQHDKVVWKVLADLMAVGNITVGLMVLIDSLYYWKLTFTPLNFLKTNLSSVSLFYGANPWHYYITQAIPILCTTALPFTLHGIRSTVTSKSSRNRPLQTMLATIIWSTAVYSLGGHKEWRFLHPILPLMHVFATKSLYDLCSRPAMIVKTGKDKAAASAKGQSSQISQRQDILARLNLPNIPASYLGFLLLTLPISLYTILFYCDAPISVLSYIRSIPAAEMGNSTVAFLMPCHSTPGFAYLHREKLAHGGSWALGCEPPLEQQALSEYKDQTNVFFDAPQDYLETYFPEKVNPSFPASQFPTSIPGTPAPLPSLNASGKLMYPWRHEWTRYLVLFGDLLRQEGVKDLLQRKGYKEVWKAGREWEGEGTRKGGVRVWKWSP